MRLVNLTLMALVLAAAGGAAVAGTIIHCGTVIDPARSAVPLKQQSIIIDGDSIRAVEAGYTAPRAGDRVVDLTAAYCLPGLIDMHTHLSGEMNAASYYEQFMVPPVEQVLRASVYAEKTLLAGFTTVRDVGGTDGIDFALRNEIARGDIIGPRMYVAGLALSMTGGHGDPVGGYREDIMGHPHEEQGVADGVESAIRATRIAMRRGADVIKISASGGVLSVADHGSAPQFSEKEMQAIVETAHDQGRKVAAHAHGDEGARRAVLAGVSSIEHGTYVSADTFALMKKHKVYLVPTIIAGKTVVENAKKPGFYPPEVAEKALATGPLIQANFGRAWKAGVRIAFGTDAGVYPHGQNAHEFQYMVEAGMPAIEAIRAATQNAADLLGQSAHLGSLEPGKYADLVAVTKDPLTDISALQSIAFVMKAGAIYKENGEAVR